MVEDKVHTELLIDLNEKLAVLIDIMKSVKELLDSIDSALPIVETK